MYACSWSGGSWTPIPLALPLDDLVGEARMGVAGARARLGIPSRRAVRERLQCAERPGVDDVDPAAPDPAGPARHEPVVSSRTSPASGRARGRGPSGARGTSSSATRIGSVERADRVAGDDRQVGARCGRAVDFVPGNCADPTSPQTVREAMQNPERWLGGVHLDPFFAVRSIKLCLTSPLRRGSRLPRIPRDRSGRTPRSGSGPPPRGDVAPETAGAA